MSDKVYQKFAYNYNKDISYFEKRKKWWGKSIWIAFLSFFLSVLLLYLSFVMNNKGLENIFGPLMGWILFGMIPILFTAWLYYYSNVKSKELKLKRIKNQINKAIQRERARDYDEAITIWEKLKVIEEAARVRKMKAEMGSVKVAQKVVQGDEVTKTEIKDSVLNRSNVSGGSSKAEELREAKSLLDEGLINEDDYEKMKKEILGK